MQNAVDMLTAFDPHSCLTTSRRADRSWLFTVTPQANENPVIKVIPISDLKSPSVLSTITRVIQRDSVHATGELR